VRIAPEGYHRLRAPAYKWSDLLLTEICRVRILLGIAVRKSDMAISMKELAVRKETLYG
jgi:hypothetical protein